MTRIPISAVPPKSDDRSPRKILVIYEDRAAGMRAKVFADGLAAAIAHEGEFPIAMWRSELLDIPEIASLVAGEAASAEFTILSLRADAGLAAATKHLVEAWLNNSTRQGTKGMVALFEPARRDGRIAVSICSYLQHVADSANAAFFCRPSANSIEVNANVRPLIGSEMKPRRKSRRNREQYLSETIAA